MKPSLGSLPRDEFEALVVNGAKAALCLVCLVLTVLIVTGCGPSDVEVTAKIEQEVYEKKITFILPIDYTATVAQCNPKCNVRYYSPRAK